VNKIVHCISQAVTLTTFGPPICDNPALVRLCYEHTWNGKHTCIQFQSNTDSFISVLYNVRHATDTTLPSTCVGMADTFQMALGTKLEKVGRIRRA
jgi:hypothetical protein